ncbi:Ferripyoverdine receptor [Halioglobus japonicus]|nr:Ferripyoverdine receptor [Halioglobus japonicus]
MELLSISCGKHHLKNACACSLLALSCQVWAQSGTQGRIAEQPILENVVVTAQRIEQTANEVGMDIQVFTGEQLDRLRITSVADLTSVVPSFTLSQSYQGVPTYTLRGIGFNTVNMSATSTVGIYLDEVAYPYPVLNAGPVYDMQRVEVLQGPQGTLFGRNTTGGLINLVTNKPTDEFEAMVRAEGGNYETVNTEAMVSGPLSDTLSGRIAFRTEDSNEGWQKSNTRSDDLGEVHRYGYRAMLSFNPLEQLDLNLSYNGWKIKSDTLAAQAIGLSPATEGSPYNAAGLTDYLANNQPDSPDQADWAPASTRGVDIGTGLGLPGDLDENSHLNAYALHANYAFNDDLSLVSLTGYQDMKRKGLTDFSGAPYEILLQKLDGKIQSFSQEFRLEGAADKVRWLVGVYYTNDQIYDANRTLLGQNANVGLVRATTVSLLSSPFNSGGYTETQANQAFRTFRDHADIDSDSWSIYANADWTLTDELSLTTGVRYTRDQQDYKGCSSDFNTNMLPNVNVTNRFLFNSFYGQLADPITEGECNTFDTETGQFGEVRSHLDEDNVPWRVALNWQYNIDTLMYASISEGFKSGTTPVNAANLAVQNAPVKQEQLLAYEMGLKATLLEQSMQFNVSTFYYDYKDKQLAVYFADPIFTTLARLDNIPKSEAYGLDTQLTWAITSKLTAILAGTLLHTEVKNYQGINAQGEPEDYDGAEFLYSPKRSGNLTFMYNTPISDALGVTASLNVHYQSESQADLTSSTVGEVDDYTTANATLGIHTLDGQWDFTLWGNNITDEYYWLSVTQNANTIVRFAGKSRTYGASLTYRF